MTELPTATKPVAMTQDELRSSKGVGASDVAAICHLDPWSSAYEKWQLKTGRIPRPEQTAAMKYGQEMETTAFAAYLNRAGLIAKGFERQFIARHDELPFLRCLADAWDPTTKRLVEIKCPTSHHLLDSLKRGDVPKNYLLQIACMMDIFGVESCDFYVFDVKKPELCEVTWDWPWDSDGQMLVDFWYGTALAAIENFWHAVQADSWFGDQATYAPPEKDWAEAIAKRLHAQAMIASYESEKDEADARLKQLMGHAMVASSGGYKGTWTKYKAAYDVSVKVEDAAALEKIIAVLKPLQNAAGVREVKSKAQPERLVFNVKPIGE